jgi:hypothetical protein
VYLDKNYSFISAHAPTEEKNEREHDQFCETLERTHKQCPSYDIKILLGDMNAKVGKEIWTGTAAGAYGLHDESNENGIRLINYAIHQHMVIGGTLFPHRNIQEGTWHGQDNRTVNQIDHVLIDQRHCSNLLDVRSYRGANADSDHYLLIVKLRCHIAQRNNKRIPKPPPKYNRERLGIKEIKQEHVNKLVQQLQETNEDHLNWVALQQMVINTADEAIGKEEREVRNGWFDEECAEATKNKNEAYFKMLQKHRTRGTEEGYEEMRRIEKRIHRKKKKGYYEEQIKQVEILHGQKESRRMYQWVNDIRKEFTPYMTL